MRPGEILRGLTVARPHRFEVEDEVIHSDSPQDVLEVEELTYRYVRKPGEAVGRLYPTYTLIGPDETGGAVAVRDVLDTRDLQDAPRTTPERGYTPSQSAPGRR
jgi:hypothetical protein